MDVLMKVIKKNSKGEPLRYVIKHNGVSAKIERSREGGWQLVTNGLVTQKVAHNELDKLVHSFKCLTERRY